MEIRHSYGSFHPLDYLKKLINLVDSDRIPARASSLAYTTILALVPLMTMLISFGSQDFINGPLRDLLMNIMLPTSQEIIITHLTSFAENSSKLGVYGLIIAVVIIFILINKIEIDVNLILRARPNKKLHTRIGIYLSTLVIGTLAIGSSFSLTNDLLNLMSLDLPTQFSPLKTLFSSVGSVTLITLTILLLIMVVSSAKIQFKSALLGALSGAITWELAKKGFSLWANMSIRNSVIYGSLFMIPLLFVWINLAWIIILVSIEISYLHQHPNYLLVIEGAYQSPANQAIMAIEVYYLILTENEKESTPVHLELITKATGLPENEVLLLIDRLSRYSLIKPFGRNSYLPIDDPRNKERETILNAALDGDLINWGLVDNRTRNIWDKITCSKIIEKE